jgi:hypothetical protein
MIGRFPIDRAALVTLSLAIGLGVVLALWHLRASEGKSRPPWAIGVVHGILGAAGLAALILVLQGPRRGDAMGVGGFGVTAAVLFVLALPAGLGIRLLARRLPRVAASLIVLHAAVAVTGYVLLLAWSSMG